MSDSAFTVDEAEDSPGFLLWQTTMVWQRAVKKALDPFDIAHSQFVVLAILLWLDEHEMDATQSMLVQQSRMDKMTISKSLKALAAQGHVKRSENQLDTRAKSVWLTKKGKALAARLVPLVESTDALFFNTLNKEEQRHLLRIFAKLSHPQDHDRER